MSISKITLGTAQLGLDYGIANLNGKPSFKKSLEILNYAWENGINTFDTSPSYGDSEQILGSFISTKLCENFEDINIISKLLKIELMDNASYEDLYLYIKKQIHQSLKTLNIQKINTFLLHHAPDIFFRDGLVIDCLNEIKEEGLIDIFGLSVYNPNEVEESLKFKKIKAIQIPINIFDQRLINRGLLKKLKENNYTVYARSIYLQGLFFMDPRNLPKYIESSKEMIIKLQEIAQQFNIPIANLALLFVRDLPGVSSLIIGIEKLEQIVENVKILKEKALNSEIYKRIRDEFSNVPEKIVNPSLWKKKTL
ncbi:MAG: aldo/keto reductase [Promethearchaeota archaeon]